MIPKQNLSKHDFKTGKPKKKRGIPIASQRFSHQQHDELMRSIHETQRMGRTIGNLGEGARIPTGRPIEKSRTEKFFELPTLVKVSWVSLFLLFIIPTFGMLFLFVAGMFGTRTVNPEGVEYYEIYMNALSVIRIIGICISGLTLSIHTLWKLK
jgi:hypothetical protein